MPKQQKVRHGLFVSWFCIVVINLLISGSYLINLNLLILLVLFLKKGRI